MKNIALQEIILSEKTETLIHQYKKHHGILPDLKDKTCMLAWLCKEHAEDATRRLLTEELRTALLCDLLASMAKDTTLKKVKKSGWWTNAKLVLLAILGTLLAICQGFDGITSVLGSFAIFPPLAVIGVGVCFSFLSVAVFYGFDLVDISKSLGVTFGSSNRMLDILLEQAILIKKIRKQIDGLYVHAEAQATRAFLSQIGGMLKIRFDALDEARSMYANKLKKTSLRVIKILTEIPTALFYFAGGFFAGQSLFMTLAIFLMMAIPPTSLPILAGSIIMGLAALGMYWFVQRPSLENLLGRWMGLDKENIDVFTNPEKVEKEREALHALKERFVKIDKVYEGHKQHMLQSNSHFFGLKKSRSYSDMSTLLKTENAFDKRDGNFTLGTQRSGIQTL